MSMCPLAENTLVPTIKNNEVIVRRYGTFKSENMSMILKDYQAL